MTGTQALVDRVRDVVPVLRAGVALVAAAFFVGADLVVVVDFFVAAALARGFEAAAFAAV